MQQGKRQKSTLFKQDKQGTWEFIHVTESMVMSEQDHLPNLHWGIERKVLAHSASSCCEQVIAHEVIYRRRAWNVSKPIFMGAQLCNKIKRH